MLHILFSGTDPRFQLTAKATTTFQTGCGTPFVKRVLCLNAVELLQLSTLEEDGKLFNIVTSPYFAVRGLFFSACPDHPSQARTIEYFQPHCILNSQWPSFVSINEQRYSLQKMETFVWRRISQRPPSTGRSCRNALCTLSILVVTSSFACSFGRGTDPRYFQLVCC